MYARGQADADADKTRIANSEQPLGPIPPDPQYPRMYLLGYHEGMGGTAA